MTERDLEVDPPKTWAAGMPGVRQVAGVLLRADAWPALAATLRNVNQKHGFDCPGCAWPEGEKRKVAEFCENGAKAVAEEATVRRVTADFFREHS